MKEVKIFNSEEEAKRRIPINSAKLLLLGNRRICLTHTPQGFFAIGDTCPHLGESLHKGTMNYLNEIVCPWHNYRFDLTTGRESQARCIDAVTYKVRIDSSGLFLSIN